MGKINKYKRLLSLTAFVLILSACGSNSSIFNGNIGNNMESGVPFSNEYSSPSELRRGDLMYLDFSSTKEVDLDFKNVESNAEFILVIGSANKNGIESTMQISSNFAAIVEKDVGLEMSYVPDEDIDYSADEVFSAWLRAAEFELAATEPLPQEYHLSEGKLAKAGYNNNIRSFRVLSSFLNVTSYTIVDGEIRCNRDNIVLYVDTRVGSDILTDEDIDNLCNIYDRTAGKEQELIGEASDINQDGKIAILLTPQVNKLGAMGGGIITGYFWAGDLYNVSSSNPASNQMEIIYAMVPDPNGNFGMAVSKDFVMSNLLPPLLAHELQHAISYNQHVFINGGPPEQNWLNEGISHLMEDIMGYGIEILLGTCCF